MTFKEQVTSKLSAAVLFLDGLDPSKPAKGPLYVKASTKYEPRQHQSGYFLFFDLPEKELEFTVWGEYYQETKLTLKKEELKSLPALKTFQLKPKSNCPFPAGNTILRGKLVGKDIPKPIAGVSIRVRNMNDVSAISEENGGFYLVFKAIDDDKSVLPDQKMKIYLNISREGFYGRRGVSVTLTKGAVKYVNVKLTKISQGGSDGNNTQ